MAWWEPSEELVKMIAWIKGMVYKNLLQTRLFGCTNLNTVSHTENIILYSVLIPESITLSVKPYLDERGGCVDLGF